MKKIILAFLLSAFFCQYTFADESREIVEDDYTLAGDLPVDTETDTDEEEDLKINNSDQEYTDCSVTDCSLTEENASHEDLLSFVAVCKEYALDDQVQDSDLKDYLLNCINTILTDYNYKKIDNLPTEK